jgi:hypothetical protein
MSNPANFTQTAIFLANQYAEHYFAPLRKFYSENIHLLTHIPGFLVNPDNMSVYYNKTHVAFEITGPVEVDHVDQTNGFTATCYDYTSERNLFQKIVGFEYAVAHSIKMPLPNYSEDLIIPSNRGLDKMIELKWNFEAQNAIININPIGFFLEEGSFARIVNAMFFDADDDGLKTRNIKWLDCYPINISDVDSETDKLTIDITMFQEMLENDKKYIHYPKVKDYKYSKLQKLNRFIELIGRNDARETNITQFLSLEENQFIMKMAFFGIKVFPEIECEWQSELKNSIRPDFFVTLPNGYNNIVEFKLPTLDIKPVVGTSNRERFSSEINSYIAQTRVYMNYFNDPRNRSWLFDNKTIKVMNPKRILVVGRRWQFESTEWKEIVADFKDVELVTYDDIIDGVSAQLYL